MSEPLNTLRNELGRTAVISDEFRDQIYRYAEAGVRDAYNRGWNKSREEMVEANSRLADRLHQLEVSNRDAYDKGLRAGADGVETLREKAERLSALAEALLDENTSLGQEAAELGKKVRELSVENDRLRDGLEDVRDVATDRHASCVGGEAPKEEFYRRVGQRYGNEAPRIPSFSHFMSKEDINDVLRGAMTEEGVKQWWTRKRSQLRTHTPGGGYLSPEQAWNLEMKKDVYELAISSLEQGS